MIIIKNFISIVCAAMVSVGAAGAPVTVAHRGAPDCAPENTALAFAAAAEQGVDAIECDLRLSADGVLVCHHDETTGRVWSADLTVADTDYASLRALKLSHGFRAAFPKCRDAVIPTFSEAVAAMGDVHVFAEIKGGTDVAEALHRECGRLGLKDRLTVISYDREAVTYMQGLGYECALLVSFSTPSELLSADLPEGMDLDVNCGALNRNTVDTLHGRGIKVYCYTVEGKKGYEHMRAMGVDGITGDNFSFLKG